MRWSQDSLRILSDETGGFAAVNRNDFPETFGRIIRDNSSYYVLGYYSTNGGATAASARWTSRCGAPA